MKIATGLLLLPLFSFAAIAQDTTRHDPLQDAYGGHPVLANSVELIMMTNAKDGSGTTIPWLQAIDVDGTGKLVANDWNGVTGRPLVVGEYIDIISDDFDADGSAEVITARILSDSGRQAPILLECWRPVRGKPGYTWQWADRETLQTTNKYRSTVRLHAIRAIYSTKKQLAMVAATDSSLVIKTYAIDHGITEIGTQSMTRGNQWDIGFGDFNGDGLDDLLRISLLFDRLVHFDTLDIETAQYDPASKSFTRETHRKKTLNNATSGHTSWTRFKVVAGDFHHLGHDEAVLSVVEPGAVDWTQCYYYVNFTPDGNFFMSTTFFNYFHPLGWKGYGSIAVGSEADAVAIDLNPLGNDGDELVAVGPWGLRIVKPDTVMFPPFLYWRDSLYVSAMSRPMNLRALAIGDLNPDTSSRAWTNEIIVAQHKADSSTVLRVFEIVVDTIGTFRGVTEKPSFPLGKKSVMSALAAGDLDGDAIRFGTPNLVTVESFVQPIIVMGGPPVHFDSFNGQAYDLCNAYDTSTVRRFEVSYTETQGSSTHLETMISHSSGSSREISGGFSFLGIKIQGYAKKAFENGYYHGQAVNKTITTTSIQKTYRDDWMLGTESSLELWEYPLYALDRKIGTYLVQMPRFIRTLWLPYMDVTLRDWMADREVGNLLSYHSSRNIASWAGNDLLATFQTKTIAQASAAGFTVNFGDSSVDETRLSHSVKAEVGLSVGKWGVEAKVAGHYADSVGSTHIITASRNVIVDIKMGELGRDYSSANYFVTPYLYWGQNGALVLDYAIDLSTNPGDTLLGTFWDRRYSANPDPGLLLPWRLDSLKKIGGAENLRLYSKSLHVSPAAPYAGDTVHITVAVHNFSLKQTNGLVTVRFYLGDPMAGGSPIIGLGKATPDLVTLTPIGPRERATLGMDWVVPSGLPSTARIYAFVDPDNAMTEIHEDNNIGFFALRPAGTTGVEDDPTPSVPMTYDLKQNYPNPFNPSTVIQYDLPASSHVTLAVYDILGRVVATPVDGIMSAGPQHIVFHARGLASGVYFYRLEARPADAHAGGGFTSVKKMLLLR